MWKFLKLVFYALTTKPQSDTIDPSRFQVGEGSAVEFILDQIAKRGGRATSVDTIPKLGEWSYFEDDHGAILHFDPAAFPQIEEFLSRCIGPPDHAPSDTTSGGEMGWYATRNLGISLQFGQETDRSFVHIVAPISRDELLERMEQMRGDKSER